MQYKRLTEMNQWGELMYVGPHKKGTYQGWGDFAQDLETLPIEEIMRRLYYFEENFEELMEKMDQLSNIS